MPIDTFVENSWYVAGRSQEFPVDAPKGLRIANRPVLKRVREGKPINFQGAGSTCDFTPNGDPLGRGMGVINGGKSGFVEYAKP